MENNNQDKPIGIFFPDDIIRKAYIRLCDEQKVSIDLHNLQPIKDESSKEEKFESVKYYDLPNELYPDIDTIKKGLNRMEERYMRVEIGNNLAYYECFSFFYNHPKDIHNFYQGSEIVNIDGVFLCIDSKTMAVLDNKYCYFVRYEVRKNKYSHIAVLYSDTSIQDITSTGFDDDNHNIHFFGKGFWFESNDDIKKIRVDKIKYLNGEIKKVIVPPPPSSSKKEEEDKKEEKLDFIKLKKYIDDELENHEKQSLELELLMNQ